MLTSGLSEQARSMGMHLKISWRFTKKCYALVTLLRIVCSKKPVLMLYVGLHFRQERCQVKNGVR